MEDIDPKVKALVSAIGRAETGDPTPEAYSKKGASGEFGRYQFMPDTYKDYAKRYLGDENAQPTIENQNKIAYSFVKEKKDAGFNPAQIASMWNAGEGKPNAYKENYKGVNKQGVAYDTPAYVSNVSKFYNQLNGYQPEQQLQPETKKSKRDFLQKTGDVVNKIFPGKQVGESIGTLAGLGITKAKEALGAVPQGSTAQYDISAPKPLQVAGDVGQGVLAVGTGMPEAGATSTLGKGLLGSAKGIFTGATPLKRILSNIALGSGFGLTEAMSEGKKGAEAAKMTGIGALTGGLLSSGGESLKAISNYLPKRMIPMKVNDKTTETILSKKVGSPSKMLSNSDEEITKLGTELGNTLKKPEYANLRIPGKDIYQRIASEMPDANLSPDELQSELIKVAKLKKGLVDKLFSPEGLSIDELHRLNSEIGGNIYKTVFDTPETKAGKAIGNATYHAIKDAVTLVAPETDPIFNELSKEYILNNSLRRYVNKAGSRAAITLNDLVSFDVGGVPLVAARRLTGSPGLNLRVAKGIKSIGGGNAQAIGKSLKAPILKGVLEK